MADLEREPLLRPPRLTYREVNHEREPERTHKAAGNPPSLTDDASPETATIGRNIGWASAYILVISRVIGSGIFAMPGTIMQNVGSPGLALVLWVLGALIAWIALTIDMEYGCMLPRSGGINLYLEYTYRKPRFLAPTVVAVYAIMLGFTANNCIVFSNYLIFATGMDANDQATKLVAVGILTFVTIIHGCFYKTGIWIQNFIGWLKITLILFVVATGLFVFVFPSRAFPGQAMPGIPWNHLWTGSELAWSTLSMAILKIWYSYEGLSNINNVLNEVKDPVRAVRTVGPAALLTACFMYVLVNTAYIAVVPLDEIKRGQELVSALFFERVFGAGFGSVFLPLAIALSAAGNVTVSVFSLARLKQEIARRGFLPFGELLASSRPFGAPMGGLLVHYIPSLLVIVLPPSASVYAFAAEVEGYVGQIMALAVAAGLLMLRAKEPDLQRPFRAWVPIVWLRIVMCLALIAAPLFPAKTGSRLSHGAYALVGLSVLLFGVLYWFIWTILLPYYRGYRLEDVSDVLADGTKITKLVRKIT